MGVLGALVVSLLAGALSFGALVVDNRQARETEQRQYDEQREAEAREHRRPVYQEFLDAANAYALAQQAATECVDSNGSVDAATTACASLVTALQTPRYDLQGAINDVHLVGTPEAVAVQRRVSATLPPSYIGLEALPPLGRVDAGAFNLAYREFMDVAACDTNPTPPTGCGT